MQEKKAIMSGLPCSTALAVGAGDGWGRGNGTLELKGLGRKYGEVVVPDDLSVTVSPGQVTARPASARRPCRHPLDLPAPPTWQL